MSNWSIGAVVCAVLVMPTVARAQDVVYACVGNVSKVVRIVGAAGACIAAPPSKAETAVQWNIQGPPGTPGTNGTNGTSVTRGDGPCFDNLNRYVNCQNGTVTDTVTGLIWLQQANCLPIALWGQANQAAAALKDGDCGLTDGSSPGDWRLPTRDEWSATIAGALALGCTSSGAGGPSLTNDVGTACFNGGPSSFAGLVSELYWSSTAVEAEPSFARGVVMHAGFIGAWDKADHTLPFRAWPVRGGPR